jgi:hypothetical protein
MGGPGDVRDDQVVRQRVATEEAARAVDRIVAREPHLAAVIRVPVSLSELHVDVHSPMVTRMEIHQHVGHAGLVGWRKQTADLVAPRAAKLGPVSEDQVRVAIGATFFALSLYYVIATAARALKARQG